MGDDDMVKKGICPACKLLIENHTIKEHIDCLSVIIVWCEKILADKEQEPDKTIIPLKPDIVTHGGKLPKELTEPYIP